MPPLEPPEIHYLSAAVGWIGLGNLTEAEAELSHLGGAYQMHPDVLEVRWLIHAQQGTWAQGLQVARSLIHAAPERPTGWLHQAYALRRAPGGGLQKAWDALLPAADKFPRDMLFSYNLACYACQLGHLGDARAWLHRAMQIESAEQVKTMALHDEDLQPLWEEIKDY